MKTYLLSMMFLMGAVLHCNAQSKTIKELDAYFEQALSDWEVPGMEVLIIKDGEVLLEKGYGVKNTETNEPVTSETLMAIASNTKAFTSAALAQLVDAGEITWDDKVIDHLPYFRMYDDYVTQNMTIRDLLSHRSGLSTFSGDLIWYGTHHSREEVVKRARFLEPSFEFRDGYGYQNIMFVAAGLVVEKVSGMTWDDYIKQHFLNPLGMDNTLTSTLDIDATKNVSAPHNYKFNKQIPIEWINWDNMAPAGSLISCVSDMKHWLQTQMNQGVFKNDTLWSAQRTSEMWTVETPKSISSWSKRNFPTKTFDGYGLGWGLFNLHGEKIVTHGGGYDGFISRVAMVPEQNLGIVILTNTNTWLPSPLMYQVLDAFLCDEKDKKDWSQFYLDLKNSVEEGDKADLEALEADRILETTPSLSLTDYAGTYNSEMYGNLKVRLIGDQLAFQFEPTSIFRGTIRHWHFDTFRLNWGTQMMLPSGFMTFMLGQDGKVSELKVDVPNPDFDFSELKFKKVD